MNHDEIVNEIRSINRVCKGFLTPEAREVISHQFELYAQTGDSLFLEKARLLDVLNRCRLDVTIVDTTSHLDVKGRTIHDMITSTNQVLSQKTAGRCGYDFNETIITNPWDGEIHEYKCPKCNVRGEYRSPLFNKE
jgi:hypothetical protein